MAVLHISFDYFQLAAARYWAEQLQLPLERDSRTCVSVAALFGALGYCTCRKGRVCTLATCAPDRCVCSRKHVCDPATCGCTCGPIDSVHVYSQRHLSIAGFATAVARVAPSGVPVVSHLANFGDADKIIRTNCGPRSIVVSNVAPRPDVVLAMYPWSTTSHAGTIRPLNVADVSYLRYECRALRATDAVVLLQPDVLDIRPDDPDDRDWLVGHLSWTRQRFYVVWHAPGGVVRAVFPDVCEDEALRLCGAALAEFDGAVLPYAVCAADMRCRDPDTCMARHDPAMLALRAAVLETRPAFDFRAMWKRDRCTRKSVHETASCVFWHQGDDMCCRTCGTLTHLTSDHA